MSIFTMTRDCALDFKYLPVLAEKRFGFKHLTQQDAAEFYSQMLDAIQEEIIAVEVCKRISL